MRAICRSTDRPLHLSDTHYLVIHRISLARKTEANLNPVPDDQLTAEALIEAFKDRGLGTGGRPPYHGLICQNATTGQILRLSQQGSHAGGYNGKSLALAFAGNTDKDLPDPAQYRELIQAMAPLIAFRSGGLVARGHTELDGASKDPDKRCPGRHLPVHPAATTAKWVLPVEWRLWNQDQCTRWVEEAGWEI